MNDVARPNGDIGRLSEAVESLKEGLRETKAEIRDLREDLTEQTGLIRRDIARLVSSDDCRGEMSAVTGQLDRHDGRLRSLEAMRNKGVGVMLALQVLLVLLGVAARLWSRG